MVAPHDKMSGLHPMPAHLNGGPRGPFKGAPVEIRNGVPVSHRYVYGARRRWQAERNTAKPWDEP